MTSIKPLDSHSNQTPPVVFFDGVCGLCNTFVDWLLPRDPAAVFRFAPLQGQTARDVLPADELERLDSVILFFERRLYRRSDAIVKVLSLMPGPWRDLARILAWIPRPCRDWFYDVIAKNRYRWFGRRDSCRLPDAHERARFLP